MTTVSPAPCHVHEKCTTHHALLIAFETLGATRRPEETTGEWATISMLSEHVHASSGHTAREVLRVLNRLARLGRVETTAGMYRFIHVPVSTRELRHSPKTAARQGARR